MGKKITLEIKYYASPSDEDDFGTAYSAETHTAEARYKQSNSQTADEFESAVNEQAYTMLLGMHTNGFIGHDPEKNHFFTIKPSDIIKATTTISDTIDVAE